MTGILSYALFGPSTSHAIIIVALLTGGFFRSLQFTALGTLAYSDIPDESLSNASSFASTAQQLFMSLGVGLSALILHTCQILRGSTFNQSQLKAPPAPRGPSRYMSSGSSRYSW